MVDTPFLGEHYGSLIECVPGAFGPRRDPAVDAKRERNQRVSEKEALDLCQGKHSLDASARLGVQESRAVTEGTLYDGLPPRAMEEGGLGTSGDELVPPGKIGGLKLVHPQCVRRRFSHV
jgi:hypothetical protein